jgi:hypothetical protein
MDSPVGYAGMVMLSVAVITENRAPLHRSPVDEAYSHISGFYTKIVSSRSGPTETIVIFTPDSSLIRVR